MCSFYSYILRVDTVGKAVMVYCPKIIEGSTFLHGKCSRPSVRYSTPNPFVMNWISINILYTLFVCWLIHNAVFYERITGKCSIFRIIQITQRIQNMVKLQSYLNLIVVNNRRVCFKYISSYDTFWKLQQIYNRKIGIILIFLTKLLWLI